MTKAPDAFRTISEVAAELDLPQHVLRFWESRFPQIKPMKRGGGRRYYRPDDVELLCGIRHLLYGQGYTIRGVQRILREQGPRFVQGVWQEGAPQPERVADQDTSEAETEVEAEAETAETDDRDGREDDDAVAAAPAPVARVEPRFEAVPEVEPPRAPEEMRREPAFESFAVSDPAEAVATPIHYQVEDETEAEAVTETEAGNGHDPPVAAAPAPEPAPVFGLTDLERERLTAALQELAECRKLLDTALVEVDPEA